MRNDVCDPKRFMAPCVSGLVSELLTLDEVWWRVVGGFVGRGKGGKAVGKGGKAVGKGGKAVGNGRNANVRGRGAGKAGKQGKG